MSVVMITGGVRSGKSAAAESLASRRGAPVVVAVAGWEGDEEMRRRVDAHIRKRPAEWSTLTVGADPAWVAGVASDSVLLLDCLATLIGAIVHGEIGDAALAPEGAEDRCEARALAIVDALVSRDGDTVIVSNEAGWGVVPEFASGRVFRDVLARANRALSERADGSWLAVAGHLIDLKALPVEVPWPSLPPGKISTPTKG
jgi:adenosylcobinamide kinase/adenosylcobinamide-phosphate guanylyltransferase